MKTLAALMKDLEFNILNLPMPAEDIKITGVVCDSRLAVAGSIFFCLVGALSDGHSYVKSAYDNGCRTFAVEHEVELPPDATVISFSDTRAALSAVSAEYYSHPDKDMHIIGITGTKGKTTTAMLLYKLLCECGIKAGYIGTVGVRFADKSFETENTTPESVLLFRYLDYMREYGICVVVIEVSSQALLMHRVRDISFKTLMYTNLYPDHIGKFEHPTFENYRDTKRSLFENFTPSATVVNADDEWCDYITGGVCGNVIRTSAKGTSDLYATDIKQTRGNGFLGVTFTVHADGTKEYAALNLPGAFNVSNALLILAVAKNVFGISLSHAVKVLSTLKIEGRAEVVSAPDKKGVDFVIDYAHNGTSLSSMLKTLKSYSPTRLICLFGSVGGRTKMRRGELAAAAAEYADMCIITSDNPADEPPEDIIADIDTAFPDGYPERICISDREKAIEKAVELSREGDIILLAGKGHETYQLIGREHVPFCEREIILGTLSKNLI